MMDLFPTVLAAAGIDLPKDRRLDGENLLPLLMSSGKSPHEVLFGFRGEQLATVRSGKWKLHLVPPAPPNAKVWKPDEPWVDPRRPDGVRLLAPYEQAHPSQFPGLLTGDKVTGLALFDLEADPGEQKNVADQHPEVVQQLQAAAGRIRAQMQPRTR
jgi:arylsulfatase A-like enzyme